MADKRRAARDAGDTAEQHDAGNVNGEQLADPNREAVGLEPAWAEGSGGDSTSGGSGPVADDASDDTPTEQVDETTTTTRRTTRRGE